MRILGLDLGTKRIGVALSDAGGEFAFPNSTLERKGLERDLAALCELCREREVERVVVGLPIHMDGRVGPEAKAAQTFAGRLAEAAGLPVDTLDERWTTREANRSLRDAGVRGKKRKQHVDAVAAAIILRTYLQRLAGAGDPP